jgi:carbonic anhydrase
MQKLVDGVHNFRREIFGPQRELFERLCEGQDPLALFITCSDSRINPNLLTQTDPGELLILRNAGNIIPPIDAGSGGEAATIELAVNAVGVSDIIVCGHSHCAAMQGLLQPEQLEAMPLLRSWLKHADQTRRIMRSRYCHLEGGALLTATVEENVLVQLDHLRTHPSVAAALARRKLTLHGWVYKLDTGEVFAFDPEIGQFQLLGEAPAGPAFPADRLRGDRVI